MSNFTNYRILIFSENPDKLMPFYRDVLGLKLLEKLDIPGDYGYMFQVVNKLNLWLGKHSKVKGKSQENFRIMHNLYPEKGVNYWHKRVRTVPTVKIIAKPFLAPFSTKDNQVWFCTFLDPEGNCWQLVGEK